MDPYMVLGIEPNASEEEIKRAYRELARKYHPDRYVNNPLSDLAQEKMKQINEAYDQLTRQKNSDPNASYAHQSQGYTGGSPRFAQVRQLISMGNIAQAEVLLNQMGDRTAEWYFLRGSIDFKRGWFDTAKRNFETAVSMDPANVEYVQALEFLQQRANGFTGTMRATRIDPCQVCSALICCNVLLGGRFICC